MRLLGALLLVWVLSCSFASSVTATETQQTTQAIRKISQ